MSFLTAAQLSFLNRVENDSARKHLWEYFLRENLKEVEGVSKKDS